MLQDSQNFSLGGLNQASWCGHGEATAEMEEERKDALEMAQETLTPQVAQAEAQKGLVYINMHKMAF